MSLVPLLPVSVGPELSQCLPPFHLLYASFHPLQSMLLNTLFFFQSLPFCLQASQDGSSLEVVRAQHHTFFLCIIVVIGAHDVLELEFLALLPVVFAGEFAKGVKVFWVQLRKGLTLASSSGCSRQDLKLFS